MPSPKRLFALLLGLLVIGSWIGCCTILDDGFDTSPPTSLPGKALSNNTDGAATEPFCYVITGTENKKDHVVTKLLLAEHKTFLDAIGATPNLTQLSSKTMWIERTRTGPDGPLEEILPIDWNGILSGSAIETNYDLRSGDRIYLMDKSWTDRISRVASRINPLSYISHVFSDSADNCELVGYRGTEY